MNVVQYHEFIVSGCDDILLEVVGPHAIRKRLGLQRMLGQIPRGTPVGDQQYVFPSH